MPIDSWIPRWRAPLTGLFSAWGVPPGEAEDLAQDTLVEAYLSRDRLRGDASDDAVVGPWLRGIARNLWSARGRRRRFEALPEVDATSTEAEPDEDPRLEPLRRAIATLPVELRTVVWLRYLDETPSTTVAHLLGVSERAVEGRLRRARARLRTQLDRQLSPTTPNA